MTCTHAGEIALTELPADIPGCEDCLRSGGRWLHLRMCTTCGHVGCCDNSPNRHARAHWQEAAHPIIRSAEPGDNWFWCYPDEVVLDPAQVSS